MSNVTKAWSGVSQAKILIEKTKGGEGGTIDSRVKNNEKQLDNLSQCMQKLMDKIVLLIPGKSRKHTHRNQKLSETNETISDSEVAKSSDEEEPVLVYSVSDSEGDEPVLNTQEQNDKQNDKLSGFLFELAFRCEM